MERPKITDFIKETIANPSIELIYLKDYVKELEAYVDKQEEAIAVIQCSTQLNAGFKIGDKVVSINGRVAEIIGFPKYGHARVRNDVGGGIWQPNIAELKLHKSV